MKRLSLKRSYYNIACWFACAVLILLSLWVRSRIPIGGDVARYLFLAERILHGGRYYYDFFEFNAPLILYITAIAVWVAHLLVLPVIAAYTVFITLVGILSLLLCAKLLRYSTACDDTPLCCALIGGMCFALFLPAYTLPYNELGDKSFYMLAFILPYFFSCFPRKEPVPALLTALTGILAAIGFCLKPNYFLIWAGLEIYVICQDRNFRTILRPINGYILAVTLLYTLCLVFLTPEYLTLIVPLIPYFYYYGPQDRLAAIASDNLIATFLGAAPYLFTYWIVRAKLKDADKIRRILYCGFGVAFLEIVTEHQGFARVQIYTFGILLMAKLLLDVGRNAERFLRPQANAAFGVVICTVLTVCLQPGLAIRDAWVNDGHPLSLLSDKTLFSDVALSYAQRYAKDKAYLTLSSELYLAFPVVNYSGARWNFRFPNIPYPGFQHYQSMDKNLLPPAARSTLEKAEDYFHQALNDAMTQDPPALIIADENSRYWDFPDYFLQDKTFAREWKHYKRIDEVTRHGISGEAFTLGIYLRQ